MRALKSPAKPGPSRLQALSEGSALCSESPSQACKPEAFKCMYRSYNIDVLNTFGRTFHVFHPHKSLQLRDRATSDGMNVVAGLREHMMVTCCIVFDSSVLRRYVRCPPVGSGALPWYVICSASLLTNSSCICSRSAPCIFASAPSAESPGSGPSPALRGQALDLGLGS